MLQLILFRYKSRHTFTRSTYCCSLVHVLIRMRQCGVRFPVYHVPKHLLGWQHKLSVQCSDALILSLVPLIPVFPLVVFWLVPPVVATNKIRLMYEVFHSYSGIVRHLAKYWTSMYYTTKSVHGLLSFAKCCRLILVPVSFSIW